MATQQLTFEGDAIGDHFVKASPISALQTPPTIRVGLYQPLAAINADSRNYLYGRQFVVMIERATPVAALAAFETISELAGRTGDIELTTGDDTETMRQWTIMQVDVPSVPDGFGGRFFREVMITAFGDTRPEYS